MKIFRIILGLALIGYAVYSGNAWFYLGVIPLILGLFTNWCPINKYLGTCDDEGCCSSSDDSCCTPTAKKDSFTAPATAVKEGKLSSFSAAPQPVVDKKDGVTTILILGTGCAKCVTLMKIVEETVKSLDGKFEIKKVEDIEQIMSYNVVSTPGLVIDGEVKSTGKVLSANEIKELLNV